MPTEHATFEIAKKTKPIHVVCMDCNKITKHKVIFGYLMYDWDFSRPEEGSPDTGEISQIIQCQGCNTVSFRQSCELLGETDEEGNPIANVKLYPHRLDGRKQIQQPLLCLPQKIAEIYRQAHFALCSECPILAGIGIRALIEAICAAKKAKGHTLEMKIDSLVGQILTRDSADILHELRHVGNKSAHEVEPPSDKVLDAAMDVAEHLLETVWIIPRKAKLLKTERLKSKTSQKPSKPLTWAVLSKVPPAIPGK